MQIYTKAFKEVANVISTAISADKKASVLELVAHGQTLKLNVSNNEFYVSTVFNLAEEADFRACVDAKIFLQLVAAISSTMFEIIPSESKLDIKTGKAKYSIAYLMEEGSGNLKVLNPISVKNSSVEMTIPSSVLESIATVNGAEVKKAEALKTSNELQHLYYITENGCFTWATGGCVNSFSLEKPISLLLNDRLVKLFKLFNSDVHIKYGVEDTTVGGTQAKIALMTSNIYVGAVVNADALLLSKVQRPYDAIKNYMSQSYKTNLTILTSELSEVVNRLVSFEKLTSNESNKMLMPIRLDISNNEITLTDKRGNIESVTLSSENIENESYSMVVNLLDIKYVLDSCINETITLSCNSAAINNTSAYIIKRSNVSNFLPELNRELLN